MKRRMAQICLMAFLLCAGCEPGYAQPDSGLPGTDSGASIVDAGPPDLDAGGAPSSVDEYLDRFFAELCGWFVRCEPKIGLVALGETLCHPRSMTQTRQTFVSLVDRGAARFDGTVAGRCLAELEEAECNVAALDLSRCDAAFVPLVAVGGACLQDLECVDGRCETLDLCPGHCVARSAAGDPCGRPSDCVSGLACVGGVCAPARAVGEPCDRRTDCAFPSTCTAAGTCGAPPAEGEPCTAAAGGDLCGGDAVCQGGTCQPGAAPGEACSRERPCAPGGRCVEAVCVATAPAGAACVPSGCIALHACVDGSCQPLPIAGQACSEALPCVQGECRSRVCTLLPPGEGCDGADPPHFGSCEGQCVRDVCSPRLAEGEPCGRSAECADGLECREASGPPVCRPVCEGTSS